MKKRSPVSRLWDAGIGFDGSPLPVPVKVTKSNAMMDFFKLSGLKFFLVTLVAALLWLPISSWIMPKFSSAPQFNENPNWYLSSTVMGIVVAYFIRWLTVKLDSRK